MKSLCSQSLKSLLVLSLCILLLPVTILISPAPAQAFGGLSENGTAQFMGIGVVPAKILHVSGSGPGTVPLFVRGTDSAGFIIERTSANRWVFGVNENAPQGFVIATFPSGSGASVARLLVKPDGRVGIGTINPNLISRLTVFNDNATIAAAAVYAQSDAGSTYGIYGTSEHGTGVYGYSNDGLGVSGRSQSNYGVTGSSNSSYGVYGSNDSGPYGYLGGTSNGAYGWSSSENGVRGGSNSGTGVRGSSTSGYAGWFQGKLKVAGSFETAFTTVYDNYTATDSDSVIAVNNDVNDKNIIITLPSTSSKEGRTYTIKKVDATAYGVDVDGSGGDTIEGSATAVRMYNQWDYITVVCDGVNWLIIGKNF